jgi:hypothetical protein
MKKYDYLREQYPETISLDQLYRICSISKRSASYLIRHGVIPAEDTGRKTWRYRIALEDVIAYLNKRDRIGSMIPLGAVSSRRGRGGLRVNTADLLTGDNVKALAAYFAYIYADYPDVLTISEITEMTGLCSRTIFQMLKTNALQAMEKSPKYLITKKHLLEFVITPQFVGCRSNSEHFRRIIGGFERWKAAKS